jgi:hypothetical protein
VDGVGLDGVCRDGPKSCRGQAQIGRNEPDQILGGSRSQAQEQGGHQENLVSSMSRFKKICFRKKIGNYFGDFD